MHGFRTTDDDCASSSLASRRKRPTRKPRLAIERLQPNGVRPPNAVPRLSARRSRGCFTERPALLRFRFWSLRHSFGFARQALAPEAQVVPLRWFEAARQFAYLGPVPFLKAFPAPTQRDLLRVDRPLHRVAHPRPPAIREVNQAHVVMRVEPWGGGPRACPSGDAASRCGPTPTAVTPTIFNTIYRYTIFALLLLCA